ncbi:hypothetical protein [Actinomadura rugatobispora]|uniref:DUF3558 domain-containing protein n=1 Tax=Actinomadura rugatobispora TaxID=1994 RepID=A0ABW1A0Z6_9ACTN|nr:hypothetical protein GCM10010200_055510 [Actinomadura rugatobispora]
MSGDHRGGSRRADGHGGTESSGYRTEGGGYGYGPSGSGEYDPRSGEYRTVSGGYTIPGSEYGVPATDRDSGAYGTGGHGTAGSGPYGTRSGEYGTRSGEYRRGGQHAPGRRSSGTGSHRIVRERKTGRRRLGMILVGMVAGVGACVLAAFAILSGVGAGEERDAGQVVGSGAAESSAPSKGERSLVPDACELLTKDVADRLAPNADRTQADSYQSSDRQNQCVWGAYTGDRKRQLTVELRALEGAQGKTPTDTAAGTFQTERKADESGKALLAGQELTDKAPLEGVGNEGYVVYSVDEGQGSGEAIANARVANVLVTIHYSGGNDGKPLGSSDAMNGATEAAKSVVEALNAT